MSEEVTGNFDEVMGQVERYGSKKDAQVEEAAALIARQLFRNAFDRANEVKNPPQRVTVTRGKNKGKVYYKYFPHIGTENGPNRGTGNLLRSMAFRSYRTGFGTYIAEYSVGMSYARALEFGSDKWTSGVKYPFAQPALIQLITTGQAKAILVRSLNK